VVSIPFTRIQTEEITHDEAETTPDEAKMPLDGKETTPDKNETTLVIESDKRKKSAEHILKFCTTPKSILEIAEFLGLKEKKSARRHVKPLLEQGRLAMTLPDRPNSKNQKYITIK